MKILIGVPCLDSVKVQTAHTLASLTRMFPDAKLMFKQRCYIHISREEIAKASLDFTHLFFVDSDMAFDPRVLERLLERNKDIIGGVYYHRHFPKEPVVGMLVDGKVKTVQEVPKEPFRCAAIGTGCLLIRTEVFKKMPEPWFFYDPPPNNLGEDTWFCVKAQEAGFEIWADPTVQVSHIGEFVY